MRTCHQIRYKTSFPKLLQKKLFNKSNSNSRFKYLRFWNQYMLAKLPRLLFRSRMLISSSTLKSFKSMRMVWKTFKALGVFVMGSFTLDLRNSSFKMIMKFQSMIIALKHLRGWLILRSAKSIFRYTMT